MEEQKSLTKRELRMLRHQKKEEESLRQKKFIQKKKIMKYVGWGVFLSVVVGVFYWYAQRPQPGEKIADLGNQHIETIDTPHIAYNSTPPTSGPHVGSLAHWGISSTPIPNELQVHNLEDGGVIVHYWCGQKELDDKSVDYQGGCLELVSQLTAVVQNYKEHVILAPYPNLDTKIVLTAWTRIDTMDEFDEMRIKRFINAYQGRDHHEGVRPAIQ